MLEISESLHEMQKTEKSNITAMLDREVRLTFLKPCMTDIYLHIDARMAHYIRTHP